MTHIPESGDFYEFARTFPQCLNAITRRGTDPERRPETRKGEHLAGNDEVLLDVKRAEHHGLLEGAQHAAFPSDTVERPSRNVLTVEFHRTGVRLGETGRTVEKGGLARTVRADKPADLAAADMQADVVDCANGAV